MNIEEIKAWRKQYYDGPHEEVHGYEWGMVDTADTLITELECEVNRLTAEIAEKEGECERLKDSIRRANNAWEECTGYPYPACAEVNINKLRQELEDARNLAASRLADQERIERHTEKRVARECAEIAGGCYYAKTMAEAIKKKYGVE